MPSVAMMYPEYDVSDASGFSSAALMLSVWYVSLVSIITYYTCVNEKLFISVSYLKSRRPVFYSIHI